MNDVWNLFWVVIVVVSLLPMLQKRLMEGRRLALLMDLFPQAAAQRPSVQYIPVPYKKTTGKPEQK